MSAAKGTNTSTRHPPAAPLAASPVAAAVNSSLPQAQFEEGRALSKKGPASYARAAKLFGTAADAGHAVATAWLAHCYWFGEGVEQSAAEGWRQARVALDERGLQSLADQGGALAQHIVGYMHDIGLGVAKDEREAVTWWRKSAEQKYAEAQFDLGFAYQEGEGVDKDMCKAAEWFRKAAEQGHAKAQCGLANVYWHGKGVVKSLDEAAGWFRKSAEQGVVDAQCSLATAYRDGAGVVRSEFKTVHWFRKAAEQGDEEAQGYLDEWDTALADVTADWQVIYDPDPRATVVEADMQGDWKRGTSDGDAQQEAYEGESWQGEGLLRRMSPWVVRCKLNWSTLDGKGIREGDVRRMVEEACRKCGYGASVVTSQGATEVDGVWWGTLRVRALADDSTGPSGNRAAGGAAAGSDTSAFTAQAHEKRQLAVCCPDGTSHKLTASPSTTVLEVKQHVRREVRGGAADDAAAGGEEASARPFFWQDEHAVQRQHIFMHGVEDELADTRSMGSLGRPSALFLMVDTEASFMEGLEAAAAALRSRLGSVKLRDLARCDAAAAAEVAEQAAEGAGAAKAAAGAGATGGGGAGALTEGGGAAGGDSGPPCKKRRVQ
jgi:TPR repeat protein